MEAEKVLMKEFLQTLYAVADDVYLNVLFNPAYVKNYRLIGFDNKVGAIRDTAATVEGGEIGSGFSMMVAFEIVPVKPIASIKNGEVFEPVTFNLQFTLPNDKKRNEHTDKPQVAFAPLVQQDKMYQFAAAVTQFGLLLRESRFVKDGSWNGVLDLAVPSADITIPSQMEFIGMVQQAKGIYGKKRKKKE